MQKVFSYNTVLNKVTGVQRVMMDIHHAMQGEYCAKVVGEIPFEGIDPNLGIRKEEYVRRKGLYMFRNAVVFVHERKALPLFWLLNTFLFQRIKVVYIHHNIMYKWRWLPMPKCVIAISDRCGENLRTYFKVKDKYIHKIFNCVDDVHPSPHRYNASGKISVLYPARINEQKRQLEMVERLKGKLNDNVQILFAGVGPHYERFADMAKDDKHFIALGFRNDITALMQQCDYVMLFSKHEGLPITLIEATMCGTPIICNDVGGNLEIAHGDENAFTTDDWDKLIEILNSLPSVQSKEYLRLSRNSRRIYEQNFTFPIFKKKYLDLVEEITR